MPDIIRKIIHVDMDAFYASVEQRDNPDLKGKPVAVGGSKERGVVAAASYEARKYGVRSAMPSVTAFKKCPHIIFVPPRFEVYKEVSKQIREVFSEYTNLIEPLALDEAYLDVTENKKNMEYAMDIAKEIKEKIKQRTKLTASAGISYNKFLAKIASDYNKPDGFYVITPKMAEKFIEQLKIEKFFGVGKVTAQKMHKRGIFTGADLKTKSLDELNRWFGKSGKYYFNVVRGVDNRSVNPNRIRKSLGAERTYSIDITNKIGLIENLNGIVEVLIKRMEKSDSSGKTLTIKAKYANFKQITRSKTQNDPNNTKGDYTYKQ
ncbi:MAG: DNA polymerase IV [Flavobacteriales bacterium]|nr:DNA polymerase IV [Flavobacteriales bacterium]